MLKIKCKIQLDLGPYVLSAVVVVNNYWIPSNNTILGNVSVPFTHTWLTIIYL